MKSPHGIDQTSLRMARGPVSEREHRRRWGWVSGRRIAYRDYWYPGEKVTAGPGFTVILDAASGGSTGTGGDQ